MRGIDIILKSKTRSGTDEWNRPVYRETEETISDVLVGEPSTDDIQSIDVLYGKRVAYTLAIPKGDTHSFEDATIILPYPFAGTYRTIGYPTAGIEENIPLRWNKKVQIERIQNGS